MNIFFVFEDWYLYFGDRIGELGFCYGGVWVGIFVVG